MCFTLSVSTRIRGRRVHNCINTQKQVQCNPSLLSGLGATGKKNDPCSYRSPVLTNKTNSFNSESPETSCWGEDPATNTYEATSLEQTCAGGNKLVYGSMRSSKAHLEYSQGVHGEDHKFNTSCEHGLIFILSPQWQTWCERCGEMVFASDMALISVILVVLGCTHLLKP